MKAKLFNFSKQTVMINEDLNHTLNIPGGALDASNG